MSKTPITLPLSPAASEPSKRPPTRRDKRADSGDECAMKDGNDHYDLNLLVTKLNAIVDRAAKNDRRFLNVAAVAQRTSPSAESTRRPIS